MNKVRLKELVKVNLRYANPQQTTQQRDKGKSGKSLTHAILRQYAYSGLTFLLIYGVVMIFLDFSKLPGTFTYYVALFSIIAFSQGISSIYNVFFESNDLASFLPLPFSQTEIFVSKITVVTLATLPLVLPVGVLFILTPLRAKIFPLLAIILGSIVFVLFLSIVFSLCSFIVFGLTKTNLFKKHRQLVTTLLLIISTGTAVVGILAMNQQADVSAGNPDRGTIRFLLPFFYSLVKPWSMQGLMSWGGLLFVAGSLLVVFAKLFLPKLTDQLLSSTQIQPSSPRKKLKHNRNLHQLLGHYNRQLLSNASLLMQIFSNSIMLPLVFIVTFAFSGSFNFSQLDTDMLGVAFLGGMALAAIMTNQTSVAANVISLDKQNFPFVRSLPLSMQVYLKEKFLFAFKIQGTVVLVLALIIGIIFHFPVWYILSLMLGGLLGTFLVSLYYFYRDYRLLRLDWTEVSQLFSRGLGNFGVVVNMVGTIFVSVIILTIYGGIVKFAPLIGNSVVGIVVLICCLLWLAHYRRIWQTKF
ncbi:MAG TPA: ABC transporter [Ligilactobacillus acidipiscis]|uniref:ABC transporter n=1 Tax=Ligilactobacillus acidipiscis TaxID=89059 RepID=A0A921K1J4_9LACO|nr:ABC transporter [Ligilactobacillus acidipiscis]